MIKVTLPDGTAVETDTAAEAAMLLQALNPASQAETHSPPAWLTRDMKEDPEPKPRTRKVVRNWELDVLDAWTMENPNPNRNTRRELGRRLGRTEGSIAALLSRYRDGVYSVSSPNAEDTADYNEAHDTSRGGEPK